MARPRKDGMDYFPHDTDAANDEKLEALRALHGNDGYAFYFILLERIYRTADAELDVSKPAVLAALINKIGVSAEKFHAMLETAFDLECFDQAAYEEHKVLTSRGIKKRATKVQAMRNRWRKHKEVFHVENPGENPKENQEENEDTYRGFPFAKSKAKQSKAKEKNNTPLTPLKSEVQKRRFAQFWSMYPKKKSKGQAEKAWAKINPDEQLHEAILNGVERAKKSRAWLKDNGEYIPYPATWLRARGWEDEHQEVKTNATDGECDPFGDWEEIARRQQAAVRHV